MLFVNLFLQNKSNMIPIFTKKGIHIILNAVNNISRERKSAARSKVSDEISSAKCGVRAQLI